MKSAPKHCQRSGRGVVFAAGLLLGVAAELWLLRIAFQPGSKTEDVAPPDEAGAPPPPAAATGAVVAAQPASSAPETSLVAGEWDALAAAGDAAAQGGSDSGRAFVLRVCTALDRLPPEDRRAIVLAFFESGRDARLGRAFTVGPGGFLRDWPTLRLAMFDHLAQRDGPAASELAERLLETRPEDPGEWTLALRELARGRVAAEWPATAAVRLRELISDPAWAAQGDPSWLEAFDLVVAGKSPAFLRDLSQVAGGTGAGTAAAMFAAFLAADRLVLTAPAGTLAELNRDLDLFAGQPNVRAGLFARADVRNPAERQELEFYFQRRDLPAVEREQFSDLFPLYDLAVSHNLLTPPASRSTADMLAHDRAAVAALDGWLMDPRFVGWHDALLNVRRRLLEQLK
jgi:hypothetical protein